MYANKWVSPSLEVQVNAMRRCLSVYSYYDTFVRNIYNFVSYMHPFSHSTWPFALVTAVQPVALTVFRPLPICMVSSIYYVMG